VDVEHHLLADCPPLIDEEQQAEEEHVRDNSDNPVQDVGNLQTRNELKICKKQLIAKIVTIQRAALTS